MMEEHSLGDRIPIFASISACAFEPRMSWRQRRQSKEMDSEKAATSADGLEANLPERETGEMEERDFLVMQRK